MSTQESTPKLSALRIPLEVAVGSFASSVLIVAGCGLMIYGIVSQSTSEQVLATAVGVALIGLPLGIILVTDDQRYAPPTIPE